MPSPFRRPCLTCGHPTAPGQSRCPTHTREFNAPRGARRNARRGPTPHANTARKNVNDTGGAHCHQCGLHTWHHHTNIEIDHITPLADGGTDHPSNVQALCKPHHRTKTANEAAARLATPHPRHPRNPGQ